MYSYRVTNKRYNFRQSCGVIINKYLESRETKKKKKNKKKINKKKLKKLKKLKKYKK